MLASDLYDDRRNNLPFGDTEADGMIGNNPLVVCVVGGRMPGRATMEMYVERFLEHIDWNVVAKRYRAVDRQ